MGRWFWFWIGAVLPVVSGCGTDEAVGSRSAAHALDRAFAPVMAAYCESLWRCDWPDSALLELRVVSGSPEGCTALVYRTRDSAPNRDLEQAIAAGRVQILPSNVAACVRAIESCTPYALNDASSCGSLFEGTLAAGESCRRSEECLGDAYCRSDNLQCPGVCTLRTAVGGRCRSTQECSGSPNTIPLCVPKPNTPRSECTQVPVLPPAAVGERCALSSSGSPLVPCRTGLWCDHDFASGSGVCREPLPLGAACESGQVCAGDAFCEGSSGVCRPARVTREIGGACNPGQLHWCDPLQNLTCVEGTCQRIGDGTPDSPCDPNDLYTGVCDGELQCLPRHSGRFGACGTPRGTGELCSGGADCLSGSCQSDGTCAAGYCAPY